MLTRPVEVVDMKARECRLLGTLKNTKLNFLSQYPNKFRKNKKSQSREKGYKMFLLFSCIAHTPFD